MKTLKAIIIEDNNQIAEANKTMLLRNFPTIKIIGLSATIKKSIELINQHNPDIALMDIELEDGYSFEILDTCKHLNIKPIFITAFNKFALKAIKFSAIDYILKPVIESEFCKAIEHAIERITKDEIAERIDVFKQYYNHDNQKIILYTAEAMNVIDINHISYIKGDNSYSTFILIDNKSITVSKNIKHYEEMLLEHRFFRPHQSYLINLNAINKIDKSDGGYVIMNNREEIPISRRRKQMFFNAIKTTMID